MNNAFAGMAAFSFFYLVVSWFACAAFCAHVASEKDRCGFCWFVWGALFGPLALIATVGLPDKSKPKGIDAISPKTHVLCPQCDEPVRNEASKCKHCGAALVPVSKQ